MIQTQEHQVEQQQLLKNAKAVYNTAAFVNRLTVYIIFSGPFLINFKSIVYVLLVFISTFLGDNTVWYFKVLIIFITVVVFLQSLCAVYLVKANVTRQEQQRVFDYKFIVF
jgi:predicted ferric reductase